MPSKMTAADLVISRAGAITLSELAILAKPAILIPSPYVTDNHQYKNAKVFSDAGAAILIEEKDLTYESLCEAVKLILSDENKRLEMEKNMKSLARPGAQDIIYREISRLLKK
jgi:UDP-N-acetylglucosamine--N-acetylmuramyl-(pentapeptide) pyrophosphoryl-undecaprenol N-acetylglucosamine transferase